MRQVEVLQVDAFTTIPFAGNPAGVVLVADGLARDVMQKIAREMNCSETAFVSAADGDEMRFRYFTPETEVELCGHATIATLHALHTQRNVSGEVTVQTNVGKLHMDIEADGTAWMEQDSPKFQRIDDPAVQAEIVQLLGLKEQDLWADIPLGFAYTGLWDVMVPVKSLETLRRIRPDYNGLATLNRQQGVASTHVYCFETEHPDSVLHARDFSPAVGVPEDPHTGTASGALGAWLVHLNVLQPGSYIFEQGWSVGRPGFIHVTVAHDTPEDALKVRVGGRAVTVLRGTMAVEAEAEDAE